MSSGAQAFPRCQDGARGSFLHGNTELIHMRGLRSSRPRWWRLIWIGGCTKARHLLAGRGAQESREAKHRFQASQYACIP